MTPREIRLGGPLFDSASDQLIPYLRRRRDVLQEKLNGLLSAGTLDEEQIALLREDIAFYSEYISSTASSRSTPNPQPLIPKSLTPEVPHDST